MTTVGELKHDIEWKILYFSSLSDENTIRYWSSKFSFCNETWYLELCPNGYNKESVGYISLYLRKKSSGPPIKTEFSLGLKEFSGQKFLQYHCKHTFYKPLEGCGFDKLLLRSQLFEKKSNLLPGDVITIICSLKSPTSVKTSGKVSIEMCLFREKIMDADSLSIHQMKDKPVKCAGCLATLTLQNWFDHQCYAAETICQPTTKLSKDCLTESSKILQDFKELFLKQKECDVILRVMDQEFSAHKAILIARSSVFESTFRNNMKERKSGIIDIEDCDPFSFSDFLGYLYCGDSECISEENVFNLFVTADKYDVQDLRTKCIEFIKNNISVAIFCDAISLALQYSETELIKLATDFFAKNLQEIIVTVKWQSFLAKNPTQSNELFIKALVNKNK